MSSENVVANPGTGDKTVVIGLDDTTPGQVYVYVGEKRRRGTPVERAGLVGGTLYGVAVDGFPAEPESGIPSGTGFRLVPIADQKLKTGAVIEAESLTGPITEFKRPEDGSWDPENTKRFYWVTTDRPKASGGNSRLWRFSFRNASRPELGGTIDMLLAGNEGQEMLDNLTVDEHGRVLITEDPGNNPVATRVWSYGIKSRALTQLAVHKQGDVQPAPPGTTNTGWTGVDEEASGIIPADDLLGEGWYLLDSQVHERAFGTLNERQKLVEKGQLLALYYPVDENEEDDEDDD